MRRRISRRWDQEILKELGEIETKEGRLARIEEEEEGRRSRRREIEEELFILAKLKDKVEEEEAVEG